MELRDQYAQTDWYPVWNPGLQQTREIHVGSGVLQTSGIQTETQRGSSVIVQTEPPTRSTATIQAGSSLLVVVQAAAQTEERVLEGRALEGRSGTKKPKTPPGSLSGYPLTASE